MVGAAKVAMTIDELKKGESMSSPSRCSFAIALAVASFASQATEPQSQRLYPEGSQQTFSGPATYFTGQVDVQMLFPSQDAAPYSGAYVTFAPGARTAWHQHPAGQHMIVTKGTAITVTRPGQVIAFHEGEAVWCPEGVDHWHGSMPDSSMTHLVITGSREGQNVVWKEQVSDAQYQAAVKTATAEQPTLKALGATHQHLATVAALAVAGDQSSLSLALNRALDAGVSVNQLKEALIHLYPYGGFPKSLNGLGTLMSVVKVRQSAGKQDKVGDVPKPLPAGDTAQALGTRVQTELVGHPVSGPLFDFAPGINTFLQKHLFGDVFARGVLDHQDREVLTVAMLSVSPETEPQLRAHIGMALNTGLKRDQLQELSTLVQYSVGPAAGQRIDSAIKAALKS